MLNYLTTDRDAFNAKAAHKLAEYGAGLLQADVDGDDQLADCLLAKGLELTVGLDAVATSQDIARTSRIIGFLVEAHELDSAAVFPFQSITTTVGQPGNNNTPLYWADILGLPQSNPALVFYINSLLATAQPQSFTLRPTISTGGLLANQEYTGTAEFMFRTQNEVYIHPAFTGFAIGGQGSRTVEVGTALFGQSIAVTWSTSQPANVTANSISLLNLTTAQTLATGEANDGTLNTTLAPVTAVLGESVRYRLNGRDTQNTAFGVELAISGLFSGYFGYSTLATLTGAQAVALGNAALQSSRSRTVTGVTATGGAYTYLAYPAIYGDLSSIILDGAAPVLGAFTKQGDVSATNAQGAAVTLRVYRSNATNAFSANTLAFS